MSCSTTTAMVGIVVGRMSRSRRRENACYYEEMQRCVLHTLARSYDKKFFSPSSSLATWWLRGRSRNSISACHPAIISSSSGRHGVQWFADHRSQLILSSQCSTERRFTHIRLENTGKQKRISKPDSPVVVSYPKGILRTILNTPSIHRSRILSEVRCDANHPQTQPRYRPYYLLRSPSDSDIAENDHALLEIVICIFQLQPCSNTWSVDRWSFLDGGNENPDIPLRKEYFTSPSNSISLLEKYHIEIDKNLDVLSVDTD
eukprot:scaffold4157_cov189-Skeletonema_menzelii.AAC.1